MPKVGSSLVDIPVTVNRETVFIMTRFRKRRQMSVIEGDDGPDHGNDGDVRAIPHRQGWT
jgi:hypothetical protein